MRAINKTSKHIMNRLVIELTQVGSAKKLDNAPGSFQALCVEHIDQGHFSLAHYGEQNGDAMRDPEVIFWFDGQDYFPYYFRNDYMGQERYWVDFEGGKPVRCHPRMQADLASFCNTWLRNIEAQQGV